MREHFYFLHGMCVLVESNSYKLPTPMRAYGEKDSMCHDIAITNSPHQCEHMIEKTHTLTACVITAAGLISVI